MTQLSLLDVTPETEQWIIGRSYRQAIDWAETSGVHGICISRQSLAALQISDSDTVVDVP